jgi:hypothetical protein
MRILWCVLAISTVLVNERGRPAAPSGRPQGPPLPSPSVASEAYQPRFKQEIRPVMPLDGLGGVGRGDPRSRPGQVVAPDGIVMQVWVRPVKPAGIVGTRLAAFAPACQREPNQNNFPSSACFISSPFRRDWCFHQSQGGVSANDEQPTYVAHGENTKCDG